MEPIRFVFGVHFHQPVGNFDNVFEHHMREVYAPFLERLAERDFFPIVLHMSGPLLEWLDAHESRYLDRIGMLASDGLVEILTSGFYEPVLAALPRADRAEQIAWMSEAIRHRFGVDPHGLWLTERVWEPELAADLADAGVRYALVDDRHFLVSGIPRSALHAPWWTESDGRRLAVFAIDERLRYLIPFQPAAATAEYLRSLRAQGRELAVLVDDGEKFGGWPGTKEWVYDRGWLTEFLDTLEALRNAHEVRLSTLTHALAEVPSGGLVYLPTASYREMEGWSLPPDAARRLVHLEQDLGPARLDSPDGALVRGAHWRNFFVKYSESNRMHKKAQALSALCRARGNPSTARRAIGRAECNDAYWHGVFGGLYLPHLRDAIWRNLAIAERELRAGEPLAVERLDLDGDGIEELWVHSSRFSALVSPARGARIEEYTVFHQEINYANVLTRRREAYHELAPANHATEPSSGTPSIHDIEKSLRLSRLPPADQDDRAMFVDRVLPAGLALEDYAGAEYAPLSALGRTHFVTDIRAEPHEVELVCRLPSGEWGFEKRIRFTEAGALTVSYRWDPEAFFPDGVFAPEISIARALDLGYSPTPDVWAFPITTLSKSERGFDETVQGHSLTPRWPTLVGAARVEVTPVQP
ncbi:MAG TPA: alpha-amylase/4-alpha-glucanotransferase domain-containing protein [Gemmatimonadales bacterium]|nr:alpha-amylase/4-alpha-glucanotransferase domain-containing protein [Gemmatimonadales bacterium]